MIKYNGILKLIHGAIGFKENVEVAQRCVKKLRHGKYGAKAVPRIMIQNIMMT